jgi:diguanylate cyclase (GGDEF)-like protein
MSVPAPRVIVVDDEPVIRQFFQAAMKDMGAEVETFATLAAGLARCLTLDFDVAFIDKNLPDGSGLDICAALSGADCKVALVTGYGNLHSAVEAMKHGVADYFIKPVDLADLEARFQRMLKQLSLERANRKLVNKLLEKCRELERLSARDMVTGLFNHSHFQNQLRTEVERSRNKHRFSVALVGLDRFAAVNEKLGHAGGDKVLSHVARLLLPGEGNTALLSKQHLVCRLHADTFAVLLPETSRNLAATILQRFRVALAVELSASQLPALTASIGVAEFPSDRTDPSGLLEAAQGALQRAKASGGNCLLCHDPDQTSGVRHDAGMRRLRALEKCMADRSVRFVYQPIVSLNGQRPFAYEALCRPTHPDIRNIGELLESANQSGRVVELGSMLCDVALAPMDLLSGELSMFLNIQPQELYGSALFAANSALHAAAHRVVLEITETEEITDFESARAQLRKLRELGFRIALDDFGAGYQGLSSLAMLEPDFVKLDKGIVRGITLDSRAGRLTRNMRDFCEDEGIVMIAEGVETQGEFEALHGMGIELMQGFLFAKPAAPFCDIDFPGAARRSA